MTTMPTYESQQETKPGTIRHFQRGLIAECNFGTDLERESVSAAIVAVTLLSLLIASVAPTTAHELSVHQPIILASDPASEQLDRGKPADPANPPECSAPQVAAPSSDLATLPSLDSIGAQTDVTVFLRNGVPVELRRAVLRRVWTVDPAIRDFRELQENDWDFNDPNTIPGFGDLGPEADIKGMLAEIFGTSRLAVLPPTRLRELSALGVLQRRLFDLTHD